MQKIIYSTISTEKLYSKWIQFCCAFFVEKIKKQGGKEMNKRKMTSIALAAAVAISTVQLAYPANVFAHEQEVNKTVNEVKIVEKKENNDSGIRENKVIATGYCGCLLYTSDAADDLS